MPHIVKRRGHKEPYDQRKVYGSVYSACRNAHLSEMMSEKIAETVTSRLGEWVTDKSEITSQQIFEEVVNVLNELHKDVAFLYETHRDIS